jgi:hypothetical protein
VHVIMPVTTLAGGGEAGALATGGSIDPDSARRLAAGATTWTRLLTDSSSRAGDRGLPPSTAIRAALVARPTLPVRVPPPRGATSTTPTLASTAGRPRSGTSRTCVDGIVLKHRTAWRVVQRPGGVLE